MNQNDTDDSRMGQYAGIFSRWIAWSIDHLIILGAWWVVGFIFGEIVSTFNLTENETVQKIVVIVVLVINLFIYFLYYIGLWMVSGQTIGKSIIGLRVVRKDGSRIKMRNAIFRLLGYWVSALFFSLGYVWVLIDPRRQAWHDKIAGTIVVYSETWEEKAEQENRIRDYLLMRRQQRMQQKAE